MLSLCVYRGVASVTSVTVAATTTTTSTSTSTIITATAAAAAAAATTTTNDDDDKDKTPSCEVVWCGEQHSISRPISYTKRSTDTPTHLPAHVTTSIVTLHKLIHTPLPTFVTAGIITYIYSGVYPHGSVPLGPSPRTRTCVSNLTPLHSRK